MWNLWVPRLHLCHGSEQISHYPTWTSENSGGSKAQPFIHNGKLPFSRVVISAEKTYTGLKRERIFAVDVVLEELSKSKIAEKPCPPSGRAIFAEWNSHWPSQCLLSLLTLYCIWTLQLWEGTYPNGPVYYRWPPIWQIRHHLSAWWSVSPSSILAVTCNCPTCSLFGPAWQLAQLSSEFADCCHRGTHFVLPRRWSLSWKTTVPMMARAEYRIGRQLPSYPPFGWLDPFL